MSFYVANVAIIKIKPELQQDFSHFFNVEYDKIQDEKFKIFADELKKNYEENSSVWYLKEWDHFDEVERWKGKYKTSYENGVFTYGIYYNRNNGSRREYIWDVEEFILGGGVLGTKQRADAAEIYRTSVNKSFTEQKKEALINLIFPKLSILKEKYKILEKMPFLGI